MCHCEICDFSETTGTPSLYYGEFPIRGNKVKYRPRVAQWLCDECASSMAWINNTYRIQEMETGLIEHRFIDDFINEPIPRDTLTLSEV